MRALRVLGLADASDEETGKNLVCEDPATGEQFSVPCDDRLRAGARGDLSRLGQLEIEMESQLRPREIQSRIRAGASVEQVAALAGTTTARVERFAYPVLLERASIVQKALKARPSIDGISASVSVADTVTATLAARGHDGDMRWDAFKDDEGWVLSLTWSAGRSENRAQWVFHAGRDGGTLSARDEAAAEIVDPALRVLRPLRPVRQTAAPALPDPTLPTERSAESASRSAHPAGGKLSAPSTRPSTTTGDHPGSRSSRFGTPTQPQVHAGVGTSAAVAARMVEDTIIDQRSGVNPIVTRDAVARTGTDSPMPVLPGGPAKSRPMAPPAAETGTAADAAPAAAVAPASSAGKARRGQRPAMPSWEDVLLGTKSTGR